MYNYNNSNYTTLLPHLTQEDRLLIFYLNVIIEYKVCGTIFHQQIKSIMIRKIFKLKDVVIVRIVGYKSNNNTEILLQPMNDQEILNSLG